MKRSKYLRKLTWEHQDALQIARNLDKGLSIDTDLNQVRGYAVNVVENLLEPHFLVEEQSLVLRLDGANLHQASVVEVMRQHREFGRLKEKLKCSEESELRLLLKQFSALLKAHVLLEEQQFFPFIEQTLSTAQLIQAEREIDAGNIIDCSNWPDPYWKPKR